LSPVKIPSQPLGLDLWLKKGFLSWSVTMLRKDSLSTPENPPPAQYETPDISSDLVISLSNILKEWSVENGR